MRTLISLAAAGAVFCLLMTAITATIITAFLGGLSGAVVYLGGVSLWVCIGLTIIGFTMIGAIVDGPLMGLAGRITMQVRLRYAVAYALLTVIIPLVFFVPLTLGVRPYWPVPLTLLFGAVSGFAGGYVRGVLLDMWPKSFGASPPIT